MSLNIGFVSTRFSGTDGVTLESSKWAEVFQQSGHHCFWFAGALDRGNGSRYLVREAHFQDPVNRWINQEVVGRRERKPSITQAIHEQRAFLKEHLHLFIQRFGIQLLIVQNALTIPMHVPLGLALTETIAETQIPTICHHHDFYWERVRFSVNAVNDYLRMAFPPHLPNIQHAVINSEAQEQLALRTGITSVIVPNVLDFETPPRIDNEGTHRFRQSLDLQPDDIMILQPTRIVRRKGIEHAIHMVAMLEDPKYKLVVSHEAGDEGFEYRNMLAEYAAEEGVDLRFIATRIGEYRQLDSEGKKIYTLWDLYPHADLVTYPSLSEGFGNAFLEAIYFRRPIMVNNYSIYSHDIKPKGFEVIEMDEYLSDRIVDLTRKILDDPDRVRRMADTNYAIARKYYSYEMAEEALHFLLKTFFGA